MRRLTQGELDATLSPRPRPCGVAGPLWELVEAYLAALPEGEWQGHRPGPVGTPVAWRMRGRWTHVLVACEDARVGLVLVLDLAETAVHGHRVLDLRPAPAPPPPG